MLSPSSGSLRAHGGRMRTLQSLWPLWMMMGMMRRRMMMLLFLLFLLVLSPGAMIHAQPLHDRHERCAIWQQQGECTLNRAYMAQECALSCAEEHAAAAAASTSSFDEEETTLESSDIIIHNNDADFEYDEGFDDEEPEEEEEDVTCRDASDGCAYWAHIGKCYSNRKYMEENCAKSCGTCKQHTDFESEQETVVDAEKSTFASSSNNISSMAIPLLIQRVKSFGKEQIAEGSRAGKVIHMIRQSVKYMESLVNVVPLFARDECQNRHSLCSYWAVMGECQANKVYMNENCAPACRSCQVKQAPDMKRSNQSSQPMTVPLLMQRVKSFGKEQDATGSRAEEIIDVIRQTVAYMMSDDVVNLPSSIRKKCRNRDTSCSYWAVVGECQKSQAYMNLNCAPACKSCHITDAPDVENITDAPDVETEVTSSEILAVPLLLQRAKSFGKEQDATGTRAEEIIDVVRQSVAYMMSDDVVYLPSSIRKKCRNRDKFCSYWAVVGECQKNQAYMNLNCGPACKSCHITDAPDVETEVTSSSDLLAVPLLMQRAKSFGKEQDAFGARAEEIINVIRQSVAYMMSDEVVNLPSSIRDDCQNRHRKCSYWAVIGDCQKNPFYMDTNCAPACKSCHMTDAPDAETETTSEMLAVPLLLEKTKSFGNEQDASGARADETIDVIRLSVAYMMSDEVANLPSSIRDDCQNRNPKCSYWALIGECQKNPGYMITQCAPACRTCPMIDMGSRCPPLLNAEPAIRNGGLNRLFEQIVQFAPGNRTLSDDESRTLSHELNMTEFTVVVHSRPTPVTSTTTVAIDQSEPPWVITLDHFLTNEECDAIIELGHKYGFERSKDVAGTRFDGMYEGVESERRTSTNSWCKFRNGCRDSPVGKAVYQRIERVLNIPANHTEDLQLLRYEKGQFYRTHHDYIHHQVDRQCGPRLLTFFLYLSDVMGGGGTNFPNLNMTIQPQKGRALLWPNVYNSDPMQMDGRMMHQALDVDDGVKYAANGWIHAYDFITPQSKGCT